MKKLAILATLALLGLVAHADEQVIKANTAGILAGTGAAPYNGPRGEAQIRANVDAIKAAPKTAIAGMPFDLDAGHYVLRAEGGDYDEKSVFIERSVNNQDTFYALVVDNSVFEGKSVSVATLYEGHPFGDDHSRLMLSPLIRTNDGGIESMAETSSNAPAVFITVKPDWQDERYPYLVTGVHGALDGVVYGMHGARNNLHLATEPNQVLFHWADQEGLGRGTVDLQGSILRMSRPNAGNAKFAMFKYNGDASGLFFLQPADDDVMREEDTRGTQIDKFAVFLKIPYVKEDVLFTATPMVNNPHMIFEVFAPKREQNWLERLFGKIFHTNGIVTPYNGVIPKTGWGLGA